MDDRQLVTVIMSTYNETIPQLRASVESVLGQTYKNIEYIIVIDNPENEEIKNYLDTINDNRVKVIYNASNIGLVKSLNKALKQVNGSLIARMDADDISKKDRIEKQLSYIEKTEIDMVGTYIQLIDEEGRVTKEIMRFPVKCSHIRFFQKWGSCLCHPTWMVKKEVYEALNGYRDVPNCEDYDFIIRAIMHGFKLGNAPFIGLQYRGRTTGVSRSNEIRQYVLRAFLSKAFRRGKGLSQEEINSYLSSENYERDLNKEKKYRDSKETIKKGKHWKVANKLLCFLFNGCFWRDITEKTFLKIRENIPLDEKNWIRG